MVSIRRFDAGSEMGRLVDGKWQQDAEARTKDGRFVREWGGVKYPYGISVDGAGNVLVAEYGSHRISKFSPEGRLIAAAGGAGAGPGELCFYTTAYEAVIPFVTRPGGAGLGTLVPLDASIVGIVERWDRGGNHKVKAGKKK